jgi:hypothetical protein
MIADLIVDFDTHLTNGRVYLVELELPLQDAPDDVPSTLNVDYYVIANNHVQAMYFANSAYPDATGVFVHEEPVTPEEYAARRNRGLS